MSSIVQTDGDSGQSSRKVATFVRDLADFSGSAKLYRVNPPMAQRDWDGAETGPAECVVVSATVVPFGGGPETYIFPANANGEVTDWDEMNGSYKGDLDHEVALAGAGYEVAR